MLILRKSLTAVLKTRAVLSIGKIASRIDGYRRTYESCHDPAYVFHGPRLTDRKILSINEYVKHHGRLYQTEQEGMADIEQSSEYYPYKMIESEAAKRPLRICNIGCFYCGADARFLEKHPDCTVHGLDFGEIIEINKGIASDRLKLYPGYPLDTLQGFPTELMFDYTIFNRTATLINIEQLLSYMQEIGRRSRAVIFLEVAKLSTFTGTDLDIRKIDLMNPVKMYSGMYIHNYPALLEMFGYRVAEERIIPCSAFKQEFSPDHDFIFTLGEKSVVGHFGHR